jgi:putative tricarboxylic transport membrane protein
MPGFQRRHFLTGLAALAPLALPAWSQTGKIKPLAPKLRVVIPAAVRSNLDDASRSLGDALLGMGYCDEVDYENHDAKGGTQGLALFIDKYASDANSLFVGDTSLVGALALHKSSASLARLTPLARVTSDYLVVVVAANSPVKTIKDLTGLLRASPQQTPLAISTAGSVDHVFASLLTKTAGSKPEDGIYPAFVRRHELVDTVLAGKAAAGVSSHFTFASELTSGKLRALGTSSKRAAFGIASLREQGADVDITNWRAAFTGQGVAAARQAEMLEAIKKAVTYELWKKTLKQSYWEPSLLHGPDLASFIDIDTKALQLITQLLKLKV